MPFIHLGSSIPAVLPASSTALEVLFDGWDAWTVHAGEETYKFMVQTIKDINAQVIEDPSLTRNIGGQSVQAGEVIVTSVIAAGDLELPFGDEEDETQAEQPAAEVTPSGRRKRKETTSAQHSAAQPTTSAAFTTTCDTDEELKEAFKAVEQEKELEELEEVEEGPQEKAKTVEEEQENTRAELTSSELALFEDLEAEYSTSVPAAEEQADQSTSEPVEQAELPVVFPEARVEVTAAAPEVMVEVPRSADVLSGMNSSLRPPIVVMLIHSIHSSSATASFADPELAEFEAMDLDTQLDKLEKLSSTPGKARCKVVDEAMERVKIWQSTELELEMSLGLARDVLNIHNRYEDLKPTFKTSEFCKATHKANLADYAKQKAELDQMVAGYKEAKATADKLEK
ncbi:unnamed protein product [Prunus armeniaca]